MLKGEVLSNHSAEQSVVDITSQTDGTCVVRVTGVYNKGLTQESKTAVLKYILSHSDNTTRHRPYTAIVHVTGDDWDGEVHLPIL